MFKVIRKYLDYGEIIELFDDFAEGTTYNARIIIEQDSATGVAVRIGGTDVSPTDWTTGVQYEIEDFPSKAEPLDFMQVRGQICVAMAGGESTSRALVTAYVWNS